MSYHDIRILFLCLVIQKVLNILFCSDLLQSVCKHLHEHFIVHLLKQGLFCIFVKNLFIHCFQGRWVPRNPVALDQCVACTVYNMVFWFTADLKVVLGTRNECVFHAVFREMHGISEISVSGWWDACTWELFQFCPRIAVVWRESEGSKWQISSWMNQKEASEL